MDRFSSNNRQSSSLSSSSSLRNTRSGFSSAAAHRDRGRHHHHDYSNSSRRSRLLSSKQQQAAAFGSHAAASYTTNTTNDSNTNATNSNNADADVETTTDYTSASTYSSSAYHYRSGGGRGGRGGGDPEHTPEPSRSISNSTSTSIKKCCCYCCHKSPTIRIIGMSLIACWALAQCYYYRQSSIWDHYHQQQGRPPMLSDFVFSALSAESARNDTAALLLSDDQKQQPQQQQQQQQQPLQVTSLLSSVQQGAPNAKFKPEAPHQQIDKLLRVNLRSTASNTRNGNHQQQQQQQQPHHHLPPQQGSAFSSSSSSSTTISPDFKLNKYMQLSNNLQQCSTILSTPNSLQELVYWEELHVQDFDQTSQWYDTESSRYLTFEPDTGGFAAQRMVLEHVIALAYAFGRTLVLPPRQGMRDGTLLSYDDFFDLRQGLSQTYKGLRVISMEEFLQYVSLPGYLRNAQGDVPVLPGGGRGRVNWDSADDIGLLYQYLRTVGTVPFDWDPAKCILGYRPAQLHQLLARISKRVDGRPPPSPLDFQGKATPVTAPEVERLREFLADRQQVCPSSTTTTNTNDNNNDASSVPHYQDSIVLHIPTTSEGKSLLHAPFYSFFFFDDYHQDLLVKRMIRDHVRYNDVIVCAAARIVDWLRVHVGKFDAIHIRGPSYEDLHSDVNTNPEWIIHEITKYIPKGTTLYIATDYAADSTYFNPLREQYRLYFAADFKGVFDSLLPWYMEMVEQLICARSRTFVGTYYSHFSSYTNRLRGYYSQRDNSDDADDDGAIPSYYASPVAVKKDMKQYKAMRQPLTAREFPIAWRDINHDVVAAAAVVPATKARNIIKQPQQQQQQQQLLRAIVPLQAH